MKTLVIANPKGGCGKTTVALSLGVALSQVHRVCLAEQDPQGTLTKWHKRRVARTPETPLHRIEVPVVTQEVAKGLAPRYDTLIVDTRAGLTSEHSLLMNPGNLFLVPCRPSLADVEAAMVLVQMLKNRKLPYAFVINAAVKGATCVADTVAVLSQYGQVLHNHLNQSTNHMDCLNTGRSALEMRRTSASGKATHALTLSVMELLNDR